MQLHIETLSSISLTFVVSSTGWGATYFRPCRIWAQSFYMFPQKNKTKNRHPPPYRHQSPFLSSVCLLPSLSSSLPLSLSLFLLFSWVPKWRLQVRTVAALRVSLYGLLPRRGVPAGARIFTGSGETGASKRRAASVSEWTSERGRGSGRKGWTAHHGLKGELSGRLCQREQGNHR